MAQTDYGTDLSCTFDVGPSLIEVTGRRVVLESSLRRLITPKSGLFYDPAYGEDITAELNKSQDPDRAERIAAVKVETEVLQDERLNDARANVEFVFVPESADQNQGDLTIDLRLLDDDGPFEATFSIDGQTGEAVVEDINEGF